MNWFRGHDYMYEIEAKGSAKIGNKADTKLHTYSETSDVISHNISHRFKCVSEKESDIVINLKSTLDQQLEFVPTALSSSNARNEKDVKMMNVIDDSKAVDVWKWWKKRKRAEMELSSAITSQAPDIRVYFENYNRYLTLEKCDALQANEEFIHAVSNCDIDRLKALWTQNNDTVCVMADDTVVRNGYDDIIENWERRFKQHTGRVSIFSKDTKLIHLGDIAVVVCNMEPVSDGILKKVEKCVYLDGEKYNFMNVFIRDLFSGRFHLMCHMSTKLLGKGSKEAVFFHSTYRDPSRLSSNEAARSKANIMSVGPDLVRKLIGRAGNINPFNLEGKENFIVGDVSDNKFDATNVDDYGEGDDDDDDDGVEDDVDFDDELNERELTLDSINFQRENLNIDLEKLNNVLYSTVTMIALLYLSITHNCT